MLRGWRVVQVLHSLPCASAANEHTYHLYFASDEYRRAYMRKWTFGPCVCQPLRASDALPLLTRCLRWVIGEWRVSA